MSPFSRSKSGFLRLISSEIRGPVPARSLMMLSVPALYLEDEGLELAQGYEITDFSPRSQRRD
jgi:hypothetical protein